MTDLLLPEGSVLLHIGPYKTGSSSIQGALHQARDELQAHGVRYAGDGVRAMRAGWGLIGRTPRGRRPATEDEWHQLVAEVRSAPESRMCVSTEDFGRVREPFVQRIVDDLGPDRLHVLAVVRRLDRLLPSQWQQRAQSHRTTSYDDYLREVLDDSSEHADKRAFWASHDVAATVDRWTEAVGADRFTLLVADEDDRDLLPRTFEQMLGLPGGMLQPERTRNASLSFNGIELLRRVNMMFAEREWPDDAYHRMIQAGMLRAMQRAGRSPLDRAIPRLPAWAVARVQELSEARAAAVERMPVRVVGDPASLRTVDHVADGTDAAPVEAIALDSVVAAVVGVVEGTLALEKADDRRLRRRLRRARRTGVSATSSVREMSSRELVGALGRRVRSRVPGAGGAA